MTATPATATGGDVIVCEGLVRIHRTAGVEVQALQGLDLRVRDRAMLAVVGASGSGKSTLLGILAGLDSPSAGRAVVAGQDLGALTRGARTAYRRSTVGFVRQQTGQNLLPHLDATENVGLPMAFAGVRRRVREERARRLLDLLGLGDRARRRPAELSGGEQQRVAIAVALANGPRVLLADEPTGELDEATGEAVLQAFHRVNRELGTTVVIVTHDDLVAEGVGRTVAIRDGRTSSEVLRREGVDESGEAVTLREEYAVLDRAGRMQLPAEYRDALGLRDRVRLDLQPDHVAVRADEGPPDEASPDEDPPDEGQGPEQRADEGAVDSPRRAGKRRS